MPVMEKEMFVDAFSSSVVVTFNHYYALLPVIGCLYLVYSS